MYLLRPTAWFSDPPLCTRHELRTTMTIDDLADMHEVLDLKQAAAAKAARVVEQERTRPGKGRR